MLRRSPRKVLEMYSDTWLPERLISDRWLSSRFSILLNCEQEQRKTPSGQDGRYTEHVSFRFSCFNQGFLGYFLLPIKSVYVSWDCFPNTGYWTYNTILTVLCCK